MSSKKAKITRKDPLKTPKVWERARREKMKIYFNELQEVLPFYDPSTPMSRFEILQKSKICIKDLQDQNQDLLNGGFDEVYRNKMIKLKKRVKELLKRVDQLTDLLRAANIMIPPLETYSDDIKNCNSFKWINQRPKKWSEKINLVVPDEKIKSVLTLIKDYKKNSQKNQKKKVIENNEKTNNKCGVQEAEKTKKPSETEEVISLNDGNNSDRFENSDSFNESQSPTQFKENQPVDYNMLSDSHSIVNKCDNSNGYNQEENNISKNKSANENVTCKIPNGEKSENKKKNNQQNSSTLPPKSSIGTEVLNTQNTVLPVLNSNKNSRIAIQNIVEASHNIVLPSAPSLLQSNTFILTNDGNLVQLPILNSSGTVFDSNSNLITPATIVKPNAGLLTPIVINKPSPVIVLQKPAPQIIQTAQILNATPQVISVSKPNVQILNSSVIYTSSNPVANSRILSHILSKAPANKRRIVRDSTTTTYVNKIPIPALSKESYTKKNVSHNTTGEKNKSSNVKPKETSEKQAIVSNKNSENSNKEQTLEESVHVENEKLNKNVEEKGKESKTIERDSESTGKRSLETKEVESCKKPKLKDNVEENVFKPIENPIETDAMFCNLGLPNTINTSLSVSPTAAFLSSFPIVAPIRSEAEDDLAEKKGEDAKGLKQIESSLEANNENSNVTDNSNKSDASKEFLTQSTTNNILAETNLANEKKNEIEKEQIKLIANGSVNSNFSSSLSVTTGNMTNSHNINNTSNGSSSSCSIGTNTTNSNAKSNSSQSQRQPPQTQVQQKQQSQSLPQPQPQPQSQSQNQPPSQPQLQTQPQTQPQPQSQPQLHQQLNSCKAWAQYQQSSCEIRSDTYFLPTDNSMQMGQTLALIDGSTAVDINFSGVSSNLNNSLYKSYDSSSVLKENTSNISETLNDHGGIKSNFEYPQKENYLNPVSKYNSERTIHKKTCSNTGNDPTYMAAKNQSGSYHVDSNPPYQLIPAKEVTNQRNARTVNWMTEPDVRNRGMAYGPQSDKINVTKAPAYAQTDSFYLNNQNPKIISECSEQFVNNDPSKLSYHKNDYFGKDQRCKTIEKRTDSKCYSKAPQNSYNIFDYNYNANCYNEDDSSKYCNAQTFSSKTKKNNLGVNKKKSEGIHHLPPNEQQSTVESIKRSTEQILTNIDYNPIPNQECFTWMPGKNVEWLPSKSFGLDTNLVVPSTLPTLVGDLALGTTTTNDINFMKSTNPKICQSNLKILSNDITKDYVDLGMTNNPAVVPKHTENVDGSKQYLEPFANLSKNIFDVTPSNVHNSQMPKSDFDKVNFLGNNNNETIVLKNIFELPVSKSSTVNDYNRHKQRNIGSNHQNTFLSVSQLVEPPTFEGNTMKNDTQVEPSGGGKTDVYQNYSNFINQKTYKNKNRNSHCKYNDRKYHGYKNNGSSSYTAEALIRSNNVSCQPSDFPMEINANFFNGKTSHKPEQFVGNNKPDFDLNSKTDFQGPNQNIYTDFNFSSPVPNFTIAPTVGSTDFVGHDPNGNYTTQNNSFFSEFITPDYPLSENVSNSLLIPPCSIALQSPFVIDKKTFSTDKVKVNSKQNSSSKNRKQYECSKSTFNEFSIPPSSTIFTTSNLACPTIFTTSTCQNLLPVPTQSIPISFTSPSFTSSNISFPPLASTANNNYHKFPNPTQNSTPGSFLPNNTAMFTTCTSKPSSSVNDCYSSNSLTTVTNSVISSAFSAGNAPFSSSQSSISFFSLSNPIIPSSLTTSTSNSLANFNLSTIFPEINQKGNYHYS